jgi:hypothetical protein
LFLAVCCFSTNLISAVGQSCKEIGAPSGLFPDTRGPMGPLPRHPGAFIGAQLFDFVFLSPFLFSPSRAPLGLLWGPFPGLPRTFLGPTFFYFVFLSPIFFSPPRCPLGPLPGSPEAPFDALSSASVGELSGLFPGPCGALILSPGGFHWGLYYLIPSSLTLLFHFPGPTEFPLGSLSGPPWGPL